MGFGKKYGLGNGIDTFPHPFQDPLKEARKDFSLHARAQSTHAITKMYASAK